MSKKTATAKSVFHYTVQNKLPKLGTLKTEWDLKKHYYKSEKDPQIEKDLAATEKFYSGFAKKYRNSDFCSNPKTLRKALDELEENALTGQASRPGRYFGLRVALNSKDTIATKQLNIISDRLTKAGNQLVFFSLELGKINHAKQQEFLNDPLLAPYQYYLETIFKEAKHNLSEPEEKILNLLAGPSYGMWIDATERMLGNRTITYKKQTLGLNEAIDSIAKYPSKEKPRVWSLVTKELSDLAEVAENELTAIVTRKKISDELRGYAKPYSATVQGYQDDVKSVEALVESVSTEGFKLSHKFYKLKAKLQGLKQLHYTQRQDSIGKAPIIPYEQAVEICRDVFYGVKTEYGEIFDRMLTNAQIDVYPKAGKQGGAFMAGQVAQPTKVFLNQADTFNSFKTLAHEMGHAIHTERSKVQPPRYEGHSTVTAETASTLFENLVFDAVFAQAPESSKLTLLHDKLSQNIATIQRQIAFFNFELDMHNTIRTHGAMTKEELNAMMQKHLKSYMGPAVSITEEDGHSYVYISHFRMGFYVYSYAYGILMSSIMSDNYAHDNRYLENIDAFLCAGESADVRTIFKSIGIDTTKAATFNYGLQKMKSDIELLEKMSK